MRPSLPKLERVYEPGPGIERSGFPFVFGMYTLSKASREMPKVNEHF